MKNDMNIAILKTSIIDGVNFQIQVFKDYFKKGDCVKSLVFRLIDVQDKDKDKDKDKDWCLLFVVINQMKVSHLIGVENLFLEGYSYGFSDTVIEIHGNKCFIKDYGELGDGEERELVVDLNLFLKVMHMLIYSMQYLYALEQRHNREYVFLENQFKIILPSFTAFCAKHGVEVEEHFTPDPEFFDAFPEMRE